MLTVERLEYPFDPERPRYWTRASKGFNEQPGSMNKWPSEWWGTWEGERSTEGFSADECPIDACLGAIQDALARLEAKRRNWRGRSNQPGLWAES